MLLKEINYIIAFNQLVKLIDSRDGSMVFFGRWYDVRNKSYEILDLSIRSDYIRILVRPYAEQ